MEYTCYDIYVRQIILFSGIIFPNNLHNINYSYIAQGHTNY